MSNFDDDLLESASKLKIAEDELIKLFRRVPDLFTEEDNIEIIPVENVYKKDKNKKEEEITEVKWMKHVLQVLDRQCGIDYFVAAGNKVVSLAWRIGKTTEQRFRDRGVYNAFSLRERRKNEPSNSENCELMKRLYAIEHDLIYPKFTAEAYFINDRMVSMALARTAHIYDAYKHYPVRKCLGDDVQFWGVSWEMMHDNFYSVYDWYVDDAHRKTHGLPYEYKDYILPGRHGTVVAA